MTTRPPPQAQSAPQRPAPYKGGNARTSYMSAPGDPPAPDDPLLAFTPAPRSNPRKNTLTAARQRDFIAALAASGIVTQAARAVGASTDALYKLRHKPGAEEFSAAWDEAIDRGMQRLEDCALARAIAGEERLVVSAGKVLGMEIRHNDSLVMFFLKNRLAGRYGSNIRPGHPLYERIREEVLAQERARIEESEDSVLATLSAKIRVMREGEEALQLMLAGNTADNDCDAD